MNKPKVKIIGTDGNVFSVMGKVENALKKAGRVEDIKPMIDRVWSSGSYDEALGIMMEYVDME